MGRVVQDDKLRRKTTMLFWYTFVEKAKYVLKNNNTSTTRLDNRGTEIILSNQKAG